LSAHKKIVLLGAGHAHLHVIRHWQRAHAPNAELIVVSPRESQIYSGMLPGLMGGTYKPSQCELPVARVIKNSPATWIQSTARHIDMAKQVVVLENGRHLSFDTLSIDIGSTMDPDELDKRIPGAGEHGVRIRPIDDFAQQWPATLASLRTHPHSIAVVGAGAAGVETVLAVAKALAASKTQAGLTLIAGARGLMHTYSPRAKRLAAMWLKRAGVQVIEQRCVGLSADTLSLHGGLRLQCDLAILTTGGHAPKLLTQSGLSLNDHGYIRVNEYGQSHSHPNVFAAGDVSANTPYPHPRSGVYAVRAGPPLLVNLIASANSTALTAYKPPMRTLNLLNLGNGRALATWGRWAACSRVFWWWKNAIDKGFIAKQLTTMPQKTAGKVGGKQAA
jgi:pyridine nucleotide-disulfide oxidoreductase family protein